MKTFLVLLQAAAIEGGRGLNLTVIGADKEYCRDLSMKITGLDEVMKELHQASKALAELDGEIGSVRFDPEDPASIELAICNMEALLDERMVGYEGNPFVGPLIEEMKQKYREAIIEKAAEARLKGDME